MALNDLAPMVITDSAGRLVVSYKGGLASSLFIGRAHLAQFAFYILKEDRYYGQTRTLLEP
jgi:hypothetical protein